MRSPLRLPRNDHRPCSTQHVLAQSHRYPVSTHQLDICLPSALNVHQSCRRRSPEHRESARRRRRRSRQCGGSSGSTCSGTCSHLHRFDVNISAIGRFNCRRFEWSVGSGRTVVLLQRRVEVDVWEIIISIISNSRYNGTRTISASHCCGVGGSN